MNKSAQHTLHSNATPICPNCDYDLCTQLKLQHPNYIADGIPVEIQCDDCGHTFTWPRVTPAKAPKITYMSSSDIRLFFLITALSFIALVIFALLIT